MNATQFVRHLGYDMPQPKDPFDKVVDQGPLLRYMSPLDVFLFETSVSLGDSKALSLTRSNRGWE